jgi:hypothetical protein
MPVDFEAYLLVATKAVINSMSQTAVFVSRETDGGMTSKAKQSMHQISERKESGIAKHITHCC